MSEKYASKVINLALSEVGYLEKKSGTLSYLYNKTANAGTANYTKYGYEMHKVYPSVMDYPAYWCDAFVDWCFYTAYGIANAKGLLGGNFNDYTVASAQLYKNKNAYHKSNPQIGDQIFFDNGTRICHTGLVYNVDSKYVYTVEGNTSGGSTLVSNGGGVAKKQYLLTYNRINGYGRPKYDIQTTSGDYSLVFNATYYSNKYADLKTAFGTDATKLLNHFLTNGINESRQAISTFNVSVYKANNADLQKAFGNNMIKYVNHYIQYGHNENRKCV